MTTRVLLDTNILIHREAQTVVRDDIGTLFRWLEQLKYERLVHPQSLEEVKKHADPKVVRTLERKLESYRVLKTKASDTPEIASLRLEDKSENDIIDTSMLAEVAGDRVDLLITEDRGIHRKAARIALNGRVFTIDAFLEKVNAENPALADYKVLSVKKVLFGDVKLEDAFFDSFRADYADFNKWFNRKADETAYVCTSESGDILAFLYLKREGMDEDYADISPRFRPAQRLKIGTFKVISNGYKLGERFLKIIFDNALRYQVDEIYVTIFRRTVDQYRLIRLLEDWGFALHGEKAGDELVYVRDFKPSIDMDDPKRTFPYIAASGRKWVVPIYPDYHTELLPDSILKTEDPADFEDNKPNRNALSKVYISRSFERGLRTGDIVVFYRTKTPDGPAWYTSVATSIGVVQEVISNIPDLKTFLAVCRKRSVFTDVELAKFWHYSPGNRPFVVNFLFVYSLPKRPNLKQLDEIGMVKSSAVPRGFARITDLSFERMLEVAHAEPRFIVR
jgi:predicted nucleic acid-binding protein